MTKLDMIKAMTEKLKAVESTKGDKKLKYTQAHVKEIVDVLQEVIYEGVKDEDGIKVIDGLKITRTLVEEKEGRNPQTGESLIIPAHYRVSAKFGKAFKDAANA